MRISFSGDYALKAILDLALSYNNGLSRIQDIAKRQDIPLKYLEQILLTLKGAGYVKSQRGPKGGYYLAKDPGDIMMGEVIRLVEGPISPITCVSRSCYKRCREEGSCIFRPIFDRIRTLTENVVDKTSFADLCKKYPKESSMYYI